MKHKQGVIAMTVLTSYLFCGATSTTPQSCNNSNDKINFGPSTGEVVGLVAGAAAVITVGAVVLVEVNNNHHTIKGCATLTPDGIQIINEGDKKTYTVTGVTKEVKPGDRVKVHGNKEKQEKGTTEPRVFVVQKLNKDYGACTTPPVTTAAISTSN